MMQKKHLVPSLFALLFAVNAAHAGLIVNTGTPDNQGDLIALDGADWLAGQVTFNQAYQINGIAAYVAQLFPGSNDFTITLYSNAAGNTVGSQLFTSTATFAATGWNGASNLNWTVASGSYWVGLEVIDPQSANLVATQFAKDAPLTRTAIAVGSGYQSYQSGSSAYQFGLQVDVSPVPEPASIAMLLAGLGLVGAAVKRRKVVKA